MHGKAMCEASNELCGLFCRGPRFLDQCYNPLLEPPDQAPEAVEEAALPVLDLLLCQLSSTAAQHSTDGYAEVAATLTGGLAKLLMQQVLQQEGAPARLEDCETVKVGPTAATSITQTTQSVPQLMA